MAVEELLTRPGLLVLARSADPGRTAGLRRALEGLGTVVDVAGDPAATEPADAEWVVDADDVLGRDYGLGPRGSR